MPTQRPLTSFSCLTFDCFGTLVDWEKGIYKGLLPLITQLPASHPLTNDRSGLLQAFVRHEGCAQRARPNALYSAILADAYSALASELHLPAPSKESKERFGGSINHWPAYPDTVDALRRLKQGGDAGGGGAGFKLVILSNVDRKSFSRTLEQQFPGFHFDAIYTAQDIGSYKPDLRNFDYLIRRCREDLGVAKDDIIHTAQSLFHDHAPAKKVGLVSAWIERGTGEGDFPSVMGASPDDFEDGELDFTWHFNSMGEMADAVEKARGQRE